MLLGLVWTVLLAMPLMGTPQDAGLGWRVSKQASHTHVVLVVTFGGYQALLSTTSPSRWHPVSKAFPHGLFPAGGPSILINNSKRTKSEAPKYLKGYAWSCPRPCGHSKSEGQSRFKVRKDTSSVHSRMAWV